jgi:hypothetical protein
MPTKPIATALKCEMKEDCAESATMIEEKGFIYCAAHGLNRRSYGRRCRKLRQSEINGLLRGEQVKRY